MPASAHKVALSANVAKFFPTRAATAASIFCLLANGNPQG